MANNCLVTKLKSSVNADLPVIGKMRIYVESSEYDDVMIVTRTSGSCKVNTSSGGYFMLSYGGEHLTETILPSEGNTNIYLPANTSFNIYIDKYSLKSLQVVNTTWTENRENVGVNVEDIDYASNLEYIINLKGYGDISKINHAPYFKNIALLGNTYFGDIKNIVSLPRIEAIDIVNNTNIGGNISDIIATSINHFNFFRTGVTGSIESFVHTQVENGRIQTSEPLYCNNLLNYCSFGGMTTGSYTFFFLEWNTEEKIFIYEGGTAETCPIVWEKGATSEQISAWEQAGKNVIQIN